MANSHHNADPFNLADFVDPDLEDDDNSGGTSSSGTGAPLVDPTLFGLTNHLFLELLRKEEAKIGKGVPFTIDPNQQIRQEGQNYKTKRHPWLNSQRFDGIADKRLNQNPVQNTDAQKKYAELQNQLQNRPAPSATITPSATVPKLRPNG